MSRVSAWTKWNPGSKGEQSLSGTGYFHSHFNLLNV